jgi:L-arabinose isomerase
MSRSFTQPDGRGVPAELRAAIPRRKPLVANVGIFGVGHSVYWRQFDGLLDEMHSKLNLFAGKVRALGVNAIDFGMVDNAQSAYAVRERLRAAPLDLIFCDMVTYATSATFASIVSGVDVPIVLVALQPLRALDYKNASTYMQLANDDLCAVPEFTGVAIRMGRRVPDVILGTLEDDPVADAEIAEWCRIACVLHDLKRARIGHFGHVIENMLDMQTDHAALTASFGCHIVQTEPDQLMRHFRNVSSKDLDAKKKQVLEVFATPDPKSDPITRKLTDEDLDVGARAAVALERFVEEFELDGLAYYYEGEEDSSMAQLVSSLIIGNSLLTAGGFPMCGESDLKTCIAMLIEDRLDIGGSLAEFHPIDFNEGFVLVGHDGPHHINIADEKPILRSLVKYHGKPGSGASVEFRIKEGPITMLSISHARNGRFKFVIAEGQSVRGSIPPTGNTNTRGFFQPDVRTFLKRWVAEGPTHHFALCVGHYARSLEKIGEILSLETAVVAREKQ